MIRLAKASAFLVILAVGGAGAALSIFGATSANAQSAMGCPSTDSSASDCLQIFNPDGSQLSLLAITEQDELDQPGKMWSISGLVPTNPALVGQWFQVNEAPFTNGVVSDLVGIPTSGTLAFISDPADFSGFNIFGVADETSDPINVSFLLDPGAAIAGFKVVFQSDLNVPEPSTWAMMILGFAGLAFAGWRRAAKREAALA